MSAALLILALGWAAFVACFYTCAMRFIEGMRLALTRVTELIERRLDAGIVERELHMEALRSVVSITNASSTTPRPKVQPPERPGRPQGPMRHVPR